jgi:phage terminase small subunit
MTKKQERFCAEYLVDCNATQAAIRAGYSEKTAYSIGVENLKKPEIRKYIDEQLEAMQDATVASAQEVIQYLSSVMRGQSEASVVVVEGIGDGCSEAKTMMKKPDEKERLKAAELLGKRYGLYSDKVNIDGAVPIVFAGEDGLED